MSAQGAALGTVAPTKQKPHRGGAFVAPEMATPCSTTIWRTLRNRSALRVILAPPRWGCANRMRFVDPGFHPGLTKGHPCQG